MPGLERTSSGSCENGRLEEEDDEFRSCSAEDDEWRDAVDFIDDCLAKKCFHGVEGSCESDGGEGYCRLYFKGVSVGPDTESVSAIGVVLQAASEDSPVQVQKKLDFYVEESVVEHLALLDGLLAALRNGMHRISAFTDSEVVYDLIATSEMAENQLLVALKHRILEHASKLEAFVLELVPSRELKAPLKLAREAIGMACLSGDGLLGDLGCPICCEEKEPRHLISIGCFHKFCTNCMIKYVDGRLRSAQIPIRCPQGRCKHYISAKECKSFLPSGSYKSLLKALSEANILSTDKVSCPFLNCPYVLSTDYVLPINTSSPNQSENNSDICIQCPECERSFCLRCAVPWHPSMSCDEYQNLHVEDGTCFNLPMRERDVGDATLDELANSNNWTRCQQCGQMIELTQGCYHMICWCGHEFCYACGAEYRDNQQTCQCIFWDEDHTVSDSVESESWNWAHMDEHLTLTDFYTEYELSQLQSFQKFLAGGFGLSDLSCQPPSQTKMDPYVDTIKELPWLERFVSVISDSYDDYGPH
ncbi:unnamed protein product [Victoria cruziana]